MTKHHSIPLAIWIALTALLLTLAMLLWLTPHAGAAGCGLKPLKPLVPLGCRDLVAQCVCGADGKCEWQWVCVK